MISPALGRFLSATPSPAVLPPVFRSYFSMVSGIAAGRSLRGILRHHAREAVEHGSGRTPDVVSFVWNRQVMPVPPAKVELTALIAREIEKVRERGFERRR